MYKLKIVLLNRKPTVTTEEMYAGYKVKTIKMVIVNIFLKGKLPAFKDFPSVFTHYFSHSEST